MPTPSGANQDNHATGFDPARRTRPRVRVATVADAERLAEINAVTWQHSYVGIVPDSYLETYQAARLRERWEMRLSEVTDRLNLVAEIDGTIAAYCIGGGYRTQHDAEPEDTAGWGELFAIYTHPHLQGRGAGLAVQSATLEALADRGFTVAALWVLRDNARSLRWYGEHGWRPDGAVSQWLGSGVPLAEIRLTRSIWARSLDGSTSGSPRRVQKDPS